MAPRGHHDVSSAGAYGRARAPIDEQVPTPASARFYAKIVHELALLRRLIETASQIMQLAYQVPEDPERLADQAEELIYQVARRDQKDEVVMEALGEHILAHFLQAKRAEWAEYISRVQPWEVERYLETY